MNTHKKIVLIHCEYQKQHAPLVTKRFSALASSGDCWLFVFPACPTSSGVDTDFLGRCIPRV